MQRLQQKLSQWEGKSSQDIANIYLACVNNKDFNHQLCLLLTNLEFQSGASWLLKHHLEQANQLTQSQIDNVYQHANKFQHWTTQLQFLQSMPYLLISQSQKKNAVKFLGHCLSSNNKLVRAWSYNGFELLAQQYPEYRKEVELFFEMAMDDESAWVKARIQNILKQRKYKK